ncbi:MAG: thiol-disulfide oxidoreductase DCC family protein [Phycisphaerae bacterium]
MAPNAGPPPDTTSQASPANAATAAETPDVAPQPRAAPRPAVVLYDAECAFCRRRVEWIRARAAAGAFEYLPIGSTEADARYPALRDLPIDAGMRVVVSEHGCAVGLDAVVEVLARLPQWRLLAAMLRLPGLHTVFGWLYRLIARHRRLLR